MNNLTNRERLPPHLLTEPITAAISENLRHMGEQAVEIVLSVSDQFSPVTSTWGLDVWERITGIVPEAGASLQTRRMAVLSRLAGTGPTRADTLRQLAAAATGYDSIVTEHFGDYTVELTFIGDTPGFLMMDFTLLYQAVDVVIPAHLQFFLSPVTWESVEAVPLTWEGFESQFPTWADLEERASPIKATVPAQTVVAPYVLVDGISAVLTVSVDGIQYPADVRLEDKQPSTPYDYQII